MYVNVILGICVGINAVQKAILTMLGEFSTQRY